MTEAAIPSEPIPFRVLLDDAMKLTRRFFGAIYLPIAIPMAFIACASLVVQQRFMTQVQGAASNPRMWMGSGCLSYLGILALFIGVGGLASAVTVAAAMDGVRGKPIEMKAKWAFVLNPGVLGTLLLTLIFICAGFIVLFFPGVYFGLRLSFLVPVMAAEGLRGTGAMGRSWKLVRYNPGKGFIQNTATKVFLLYLVAGVIAWAASFVVQLPFKAAQWIGAVRQVSSGQIGTHVRFYTHWTQFPETILTSLISTAIGVYSSFGLVLLYLDVVRRKEGTDLAAAIDARFGVPAGSLAGGPPAAGPGSPPA